MFWRSDFEGTTEFPPNVIPDGLRKRADPESMEFAADMDSGFDCFAIAPE